ncbi:hypothetical protein [Uliginosibacterium sp. H1]|uniref:hypothetical protein n=1 Tax=Uliginosibacterium sp. H1 TaxID=3114757 RepID=UPI002E17FBD9|nr:hypothetical protein [Uliginosibacterium sp. H1]
MKVIALFVVALLSGCATQGTNTFNYSKGDRTPVTNEVTVNAPYSRVWDMLVRDLAKSFYVINNIDKESRIINVSFTSTEAAEFVDCGRTSRTYTEGPNVERFDYEVASRSTYKVAATRQEHLSMTNYAVMSRDPTLEGRSNIYVAPSATDSSKTTVSVNTRYVMTMKTKGDAYAKHISGAIHSRGRVPEDSSVITFNTNTVATREEPNSPAMVCFAKGKLESDVLSIVKGL